MNISQRLRTCAKHTGLDSVIELLQEAADEIDALQARAALTQQPATGEPVAKAWEEGYRRGVEDERTSNANIGIAGFGAKVDPARQNPYRDAAHPAPSVPDDDFDLICNAIDKAATITMEGDYMLDSDDCIAVVRVMQVLLSVRAAMLAAK